MENFDFLNSFFFPYVNWIVFLVLAYFVLRKPFINALRAKRESYADLLRRASQAKEEAERRNAEIKARLARLDREVEEIKSQARQQAEQEARAVLSSAEQLAEHLKREARRMAEAEVAAAKIELQQEILKQVKIQSIEHLQQTLDETRQHRVVQQSLASLGQVRAEVSP